MVHKFVDHKFVYQYFFFYLCNQINLFVEAIMDRAFVYGMSVEGDNFTDRVKETKRLKLSVPVCSNSRHKGLPPIN